MNDRELRNLLEKTQKRVRELEDEVDRLEAELEHERRWHDVTADALATAEQKLIPHPGEQRDTVRLQAQVKALQGLLKQKK